MVAISGRWKSGLGSFAFVASPEDDPIYVDPLEEKLTKFVGSIADRLLRLGMKLASLESLLQWPEAQERLEDAIEELDATVREVRATAFGLLAEEKPGEE